MLLLLLLTPPQLNSFWLIGTVFRVFRIRLGFENLYFTRTIYPVAKQTENNKLTDLTINTNSKHVQHDEVGNRETIHSKSEHFGYEKH